VREEGNEEVPAITSFPDFLIDLRFLGETVAA
jgi:hypothetical protein